MTAEEIQKKSMSLKAVTQDVKWEHHLCFNIGDKMFLGVDQVPVSASVKVSDEDFEVLCQKEGIVPAPYLARHKWVKVDDINSLSSKDWDRLIEQAYGLVKAKLSKKLQKELGVL